MGVHVSLWSGAAGDRAAGGTQMWPLSFICDCIASFSWHTPSSFCPPLLVDQCLPGPLASEQNLVEGLSLSSGALTLALGAGEVLGVQGLGLSPERSCGPASAGEGSFGPVLAPVQPRQRAVPQAPSLPTQEWVLLGMQSEV